MKGKRISDVQRKLLTFYAAALFLGALALHEFGPSLICFLMGGGILFFLWWTGQDERWLRNICSGPGVDIFYDGERGYYYTEGCVPGLLLYVKDAPLEEKTFALSFCLLLPPRGSGRAYAEIMTGIEEWMAARPWSMRLLSHGCVSCQMATVELCVPQRQAGPEARDALFAYYDDLARQCYERWKMRYIRVDYGERGHVFYASFDGFSIDRAMICAGERTFYLDLGDSRDVILASPAFPEGPEGEKLRESLDEAFSDYIYDNALERIRQDSLISVEDFEALWSKQPSEKKAASSVHDGSRERGERAPALDEPAVRP